MIRISPEGIEAQTRLVGGLRSPAAYRDAVSPVSDVTVLETHISYVLLTGQYAYKIKKAVNLAFLDFSTLAARHTYCQHELRLNRRLAPAVYLDVVAITGTLDCPSVGGDGTPIEYAVKMREFPQDALLSRMLTSGALLPAHVDALAAQVAAFHRSIDSAPADGPFGIPNDILELALENFSQTRPLLATASDRTALDTLQDWTRREYDARATAMQRRRQDGYVRECHGDLHLGNIALVDDAITIFDCIEFNDEMRWIDVMSEVAFTVMDLQDRRRFDLAFRFLTAYLEHTGDYAGMELLRFYLVYRAMVRAKVTAIRSAQLDPPHRDGALLDEYREYVKLASSSAGSSRAAIVIMQGPAGSGKTTCSQALVESLGAIRIRTDVERKRLHGLMVSAGSGSPLEGGLYTATETARTYQSVCAAARQVTAAGFAAIVDGSFLKRQQRDLLRGLAAELRIPFLMVVCTAPEATLRARVSERLRRGGDASEADLAVLEHQLSSLEPIGADEVARVVSWDADAPPDQMRDVVRTVEGRLDSPAVSTGGTP